MQLETMEERIALIKSHHAPIVFWGTGEKAKGTVPTLQHYGLHPVCFCDSDQKKWGSRFFDTEILSPEKAKELYPNAVYVICVWVGHYEEIVKELSGCVCYHCNYPFKTDTSFLTITDDSQKERLNAMREMLADEESKELFQLVLNYKLNGDITPLLNKIDGDSMFDDLLEKRYCAHETYIDCGAYTGDTMIQFLELCRGKYGRIRLFEGDHNNCSWMNKLIGLTRIRDATVHEQLLWHQSEMLDFYTFDIDSDNYVYENGDVSDWRKDNPCSRKIDKLEQMGKYTAQHMLARRLDELVCENENVGLIKICVVGSDMNVLKGCEQIMRRQKPAIAIKWAGCKEQDVWEMIPFIKTCRGDYKIYLRQKRLWKSTKTILYAL